MNVVRDEIIEVASAPMAPLRYDKIKKLSWEDNLPVQALLDVVASIIADEYIRIAKQNKDVFTIASAPAASRNDVEV